MVVVALLLSVQLAADAPTLLLEKVRHVDDARAYDVRDPEKGDRVVPFACALAGRTTVKLVQADDATLEVERGGVTKKLVVRNVRGVSRSMLACGETDDFYYANPRLGTVYAYSADRLFQGADPVVWTRELDPFKNADQAQNNMIDTSVATAVLVRQHRVFVEWFFRQNGGTGFFHQVFEGATGESLGKLGPSDLLAKSNDHDPWWILFQGGGNDVLNYVPQNIFRLKYGPPGAGAQPATEVLATLRSAPSVQRMHPVAPLSPNPIVNHMIALLTPTRSAQNTAIEFCPSTPAQRAEYWLGQDYEPMLGELARNALMSFWAERQASGVDGNPIDAWFKAEIAPNEPMKSLLAHFSPQDDAWVGGYEQALLAQGGPKLERIAMEFGSKSGVITRVPSPQKAP
jgi:hypothetical protein